MLEDENTKLLEQLESTRSNGGATEQTLLNRLETSLLKRLEPTGPEIILQALVNDQKKALADLQEELGMVDADRLGVREELAKANADGSRSQQKLEAVKETLEALKSEFSTFRYSINNAVDIYYYGRATLPERISETKTELEALGQSLKGVFGSTNLAKIETLKIGCQGLNSASMELEDTRKDRDGIYNTLDVANCLQAHLTIGDLKLSQLECEVLRKAIGDFEDEEAVREIKRLKKADLELVKVVSALDGCVGGSNVAKIDTLKTACKME